MAINILSFMSYHGFFYLVNYEELQEEVSSYNITELCSPSGQTYFNNLRHDKLHELTIEESSDS